MTQELNKADSVAWVMDALQEAFGPDVAFDVIYEGDGIHRVKAHNADGADIDIGKRKSD